MVVPIAAAIDLMASVIIITLQVVYWSSCFVDCQACCLVRQLLEVKRSSGADAALVRVQACDC